jgi:hypothetical protein
MIKSVRAIHWFRSDLRLRDNTALAAAAARADEMAMVFVFDDRLLSGSRVGPPRLRFLWDALERLGGDLRQRGHRLVLRRGDPVAEIPRLIRETGAELLSFNRDPGLAPAAPRSGREPASSTARTGSSSRARTSALERASPSGSTPRFAGPGSLASARIARCRQARPGFPCPFLVSPPAGSRISPSSVPPLIAPGSPSRVRRRRAGGCSASWTAGLATTRAVGKSRR